MKARRGVELENQCARYDLRIDHIEARPIPGTKLWVGADGTHKHPEEIALAHYEQSGCCGSWCEGGTLNLLMKAASYPIFVRYNEFQDRVDARRRFFEAQCVILATRNGEILHAIESATTSKIEVAASEILNDYLIRGFYPRVTLSFLLALWEALGPARLAAIARVFLRKPYDFRAGWPDLTLVSGSRLRFVEVKTSGLLIESQTRIVEAFGKPLQLNFAIAHVTAVPGHQA